MTQYRIITIIIASLIVTAGIGCTNDDTTELAWINAAGNPINDIIWANGDQQWTTEGGYADNAQTEPKKVNALYGDVIASIDVGSAFQEGTVIIEETGSSSLSLHDGSSEVYTISSVNP
jgi:hypothetical protein